MHVLKMLKISQPVTFSPHPLLYQLEASCGNLVLIWLNYASELYKRCHLLYKNLLILFVYLCSYLRGGQHAVQRRDHVKRIRKKTRLDFIS